MLCTVLSCFALGEQGPPSCRLLVKFFDVFLLSIALASGGAALSLWLERALAGLPSPLLEINWGIRFHVIWFSCYVINGHEGGQNMANHVSIFIVNSSKQSSAKAMCCIMVRLSEPEA